MKKSIIIVCLLAIYQFSFGQIKVIAPNGDVGVGLATPQEKLDVNGNTRVRGSLLLDQANNFVAQQSPASRLTVSTNVSPAQARAMFSMFGTEANGVAARAGEFGLLGNYIAFQVNKQPGNFGQVAARFEANGNFRLLIGSAAKPGGGSWVGLSDKRLKQDIRPYAKGLKEILQVNPVLYKYNDIVHKVHKSQNKNKDYCGVIAQEVNTYAPEMIVKQEFRDVETNEKVGDYLSVDPSDYVYMLVNAVKEQQKQIDKLEKLVNSMLSSKK